MADNKSHLSSHCHLEALPTELLQQIFLTSMNGNLIMASPLIAVKLSGQNVLYRATFLLAFYSHDVCTMFDVHNLHTFIPMLDLPPSSWDVRSMTRAVLGSRWCTWGQVKLWLADSLKYGVKQLLQVAKPNKSTSDHIESFMQRRTTVEDLLDRCWRVEDEQKRAWQLETCMWDIRLVKDSDIYEDEMELDADDQEDSDYDPSTAEWRRELVFQFQMRIFGILTVGDEKRQNRLPGLLDETPFRYIVEMYTGLNIEDMKPQPSSLDFYQLLEERAIRATRNAQWLRETLAIDYFFYPDDQPFKVSPRLYRAAAAADVQLEILIYLRMPSYVPVLYVLFTIDPLSLPRTEPALLVWAARARERVFMFSDKLEGLRSDVKKQRKTNQDGALKFRDRNKYRAMQLEYMHRYEMDLKILLYIKTGSLVALPDAIAPDFTEPLGWLGERWHPYPAALDKAESAIFPNADQRDVDIFNNNVDHSRCHYWLQQKTLLDGNLSFLGWDNEQHRLDQTSKDDSRYALTTYDGYYRNWDLYNYGRLFPTSRHDMDDEDWESDDEEDEEDNGSENDNHEMRNEPANIHYGEEIREDPLGLSRHALDPDWVVMRPNEEYPIPPLIKDTELVEPLYGPPKWFHAVEKPFFQELPQDESKKKEWRRTRGERQ